MTNRREWPALVDVDAEWVLNRNENTAPERRPAREARNLEVCLEAILKVEIIGWGGGSSGEDREPRP